MVKIPKALRRGHVLLNFIGGMYMTQQSYTITKRISKHGTQAVITIPKLLEKDLKPRTVAEIKITVIKEAEQ